jgi:cytochrome c oxidase subunit IV
MRFERLSLIYAILLPPLLLLALVGILTTEGEYVAWLRQIFFGRP